MFCVLQIVCSECSLHKLSLAYDDRRESKVCDNCFFLLERRRRQECLSKSDNSGLSDSILWTQTNRPLALKVQLYITAFFNLKPTDH
jgi:hypothetical protein